VDNRSFSTRKFLQTPNKYQVASCPDEINAMFTKRWHQTMDQDTETTRKPVSTFKVSTRESLKNSNK